MELSEWVPAERLAQWMQDATARVLDSVADLGDETDQRWLGPYLEIVNPPVWEIGHTAWFAELMVRRELHQLPELMPGADALYDSAKVGHTDRWKLAFPSVAESRDYVQRVGDAVAELVLDDQGLDATAHFAAYSLAHYDAHVEAFTYTRQTLGHEAPFVGSRVRHDHDASVVGDATVDGGRLLLGGSPRQPFVQDNEKWAHPVAVAPFAMARSAVTVGEFVQFVNDGGYRDERLWQPEGWTWRNEVGADHPVYWRQASSGSSTDWEHRHFADWSEVAADPHLPITHLSWHEAQAFCAWAGRRLPTEAEWEFAATTTPDGTKHYQFPWEEPYGNPTVADEVVPANQAALDGHTGGPVDITAFADGDGPWGHRQLFGNVWEWTASTFEPFPSFEPDHYRENSEPWFGTRKVLRGGSWATRSRYVRGTFRNFFTPDRRDVITGFRTCAR